LPFAYVILLLLALSLTETPRDVVGTGGYRADFFDDILILSGYGLKTLGMIHKRFEGKLDAHA
jgi:hypothetical protein